MAEKFLVTGSSGTVGTRLCEKLIGSKKKVIGLDKVPNKWNSKINKLTMSKDLRYKFTLENFPKKIDLVIHLAANARVYDLIVNPSLARDNVTMIFNILEFCRKKDIEKFIFSSSREIYGNTRSVAVSEDKVVLRKCESPYAASKMAGEALVQAYHSCYGIDFVIVRFSNVYGMYDDSDRVIPQFIKLARQNRNLIVYGMQKFLDFTYIDDSISGLFKCINDFDRIKNDVFNIASGKGVRIMEIAELIKSHIGSNSKILIKENRTGEIEQYVANISKAKKILGYNPETKITEGIRKTVDWYGKSMR